MNKTKIANSVLVETFDQNDYLTNQKKIYDGLVKILDSFDYDSNLSSAREYIDNLNSDIFLNNKKVLIFVLKLNQTPISFLIFCDEKIDLLWTDFEFAKLGYATILLRYFATEIAKNGIYEFGAEFDQNNLIADNLFESFGKIENVKILQNDAKNGKKTYKFDIKNIKIDQILKDLQKFAI